MKIHKLDIKTSLTLLVYFLLLPLTIIARPPCARCVPPGAPLVHYTRSSSATTIRQNREDLERVLRNTGIKGAGTDSGLQDYVH